MTKDRTEVLDSIDSNTLSDLSSGLLDDSRRGIDDAANRVAQTRADLFAKVRDLQLELGSRSNSRVSVESNQRQVAVQLIIELGTAIKGAIDRRTDVSGTLAEIQDAYDAFQRKLRKVLEAAAALGDDNVVDVSVTEVR